MINKWGNRICKFGLTQRSNFWVYLVINVNQRFLTLGMHTLQGTCEILKVTRESNLVQHITFKEQSVVRKLFLCLVYEVQKVVNHCCKPSQEVRKQISRDMQNSSHVLFLTRFTFKHYTLSAIFYFFFM